MTKPLQHVQQKVYIHKDLRCNYGTKKNPLPSLTTQLAFSFWENGPIHTHKTLVCVWCFAVHQNLFFTAFDPSRLSDDKNSLFFTQLSTSYVSMKSSRLALNV